MIEQRKTVEKEIKYLYENQKLPIKRICKRLKLNYSKVRKALNDPHGNRESIFDRKQKSLAFKKLHQRARTHINKLLLSSDHPLSGREV